MKARIQITVETEVGQKVQEIASWERHEHRLEDIGLTLAESKSLMAAIEKILVEQQISEYLETQRDCPLCGKARGQRGSHTVTLQTLFGNLQIDSPRWSHCGCQPQQTKTFSLVAELLSERLSPERLYLETKWASLISFELTASLLIDTLPVAETVNAASIRNHLQGVAERVEAALGKEQVSFIDGCPAEWAALPRPPAPLTVGIDGCYLRQWDDKKTHFEVIVGKSMSEDGPSRCFGYTQTYDEKPKRRLFEMLRSQGMQMNQRVMFFSDGGADIREVQSYLNPEGEQYLDESIKTWALPNRTAFKVSTAPRSPRVVSAAKQGVGDSCPPSPSTQTPACLWPPSKAKRRGPRIISLLIINLVTVPIHACTRSTRVS
jgi:hypothetical protein